MNDDYIKKIKKVIAEKSGQDISEIHEGSFFEDDLNIGEMELMEILTELEDQLHIELLDEKDNIETVQDLIDLVTEQVD
jgi:acyl carrier protein